MAYKYSYYLSRSKAEGIKAIGEDREQEVTVKYHGRFIVIMNLPVIKRKSRNYYV